MALKPQGVTIGIEGATPDTYDIIGEVNSVTGIGSGTAAELNVTHLGSTRVEIVPDLPDEGSVTIGGFLKPSDTTGQVAVRTARDAQTLEKFKVTLTNSPATTIVFSGYVMQFETGASLGNAIPFTAVVRITGAAVWA